MKWKEYDGITERTIRLEAAAIFWDFVEHCIFPEAYFMREVLVNWQSRNHRRQFRPHRSIRGCSRKSGVKYLPIPKSTRRQCRNTSKQSDPERCSSTCQSLRGTLTQCRNTSTT